jgi:transposase
MLTEKDASTIVFKGRRFEPKEIRLIKEIAKTFPRLSRQELANTICELVEWRRANRGLKTREARELLEMLEYSNQIELPSPSSRGRPRGSKTTVPHTYRGETKPEIRTSLRDVEPISLRLVKNAEDRKLWRELVGRYHPKGHRVPFGAHLRYFVETTRPSLTVVACLQLSSPSWKMKVRDCFIGWNDEARRANLQRIVNHSRFLVFPWVHIPNLASSILGMMVRQFPADWQRAYGIEPILLETLVEASQLGTCYRAANWRSLGETTGRGRMDRHHQHSGHGCKQVFVYPLVKDALEILRGEFVKAYNASSDEVPMRTRKNRGETNNQRRQDIHNRFELLKAHLDEKSRRLWLGAEALALGHGGLALVTEACGVSHTTVNAGMRELQEEKTKRQRRIRQPGGGSKPIKERLPGIQEELEKLVDPYTRGDPESPLRWTSKSLRNLAEELTERGFPLGADTVSKLLKELDYSLKSNRKTIEGKQHPDRDAQFRHIAQKSQDFLDAGDPVISVDTKKKEKIGNYKNGGREYQPKGQVQKVEMHDFGNRDENNRIIYGIPYGVYEQERNMGWVSVGVDHDTAEFAVATIGQWWKNMGQPAYPNSRRLMITADSGGSNGSRVRLWKIQLQRFADETGLELHVVHFPPGTSKWNKIEHRMFSQITFNWRGRPLTSHETIVNLISNTTTKTGLRIEAALDQSLYPTGIEISKKEFDTIRIKRDDFHPEWNYSILPREKGQ